MGGVRLWAVCDHHNYVKLDVLQSSLHLQITTGRLKITKRYGEKLPNQHYPF